MRVLVIGSCGKRKQFTSSKVPTCKELVSKSKRDEWISKFPDMVCKARDMYTGNQSRELVSAVDLLRQIKRVHVSLFIVSAGYGLLEENDVISPYECSFTGMKMNEIRQRSYQLGIPQDFVKIGQKRYDLSYVALGSDYLTALGKDWQQKLRGIIVAFGKKTVGENLLSLPCDAEIVKSLSDAGQKIHGVAGFKGDLLRILSTHALNQYDPYSEVTRWTDLEYVGKLVESFRMNPAESLS